MSRFTVWGDIPPTYMLTYVVRLAPTPPASSTGNRGGVRVCTRIRDLSNKRFARITQSIVLIHGSAVMLRMSDICFVVSLKIVAFGKIKQKSSRSERSEIACRSASMVARTSMSTVATSEPLTPVQETLQWSAPCSENFTVRILVPPARLRLRATASCSHNPS